MVRCTLWKIFLIVGIVGIALMIPSIGHSGKTNPNERTAKMSAAPWAVIPMCPLAEGRTSYPNCTISRCDPGRISVWNTVTQRQVRLP